MSGKQVGGEIERTTRTFDLPAEIAEYIELETGKIMSDKTLCPLCGEGHLTSRVEDTVTEYAGHQGRVTLRFAECDACGSELTDDADSRANKRAVVAFRKSVDGLLTGAEIRALREQYGITQDQAALKGEPALAAQQQGGAA